MGEIDQNIKKSTFSIMQYVRLGKQYALTIQELLS
jgi:hypothetical protein